VVVDFMNVCCFCGKPRSDVGKFIVGPEVSICNKCIGEAVVICLATHPKTLP